MEVAPVKTLEPSTICGMERELREVLLEIDEIINAMSKTLQASDSAAKVTTGEPSCLAENVVVNLENAKVIRENIYAIKSLM